MWRQRILLSIVVGSALHLSLVSGLWSCAADAECSALSGGVCQDGVCACAAGKQTVLGGTLCADVAPYLTSPCIEDFQCSRLTFTFECRKNAGNETGTCLCQPNHHYFLGRCWPTVDFGASCTRSEECLSIIRDPFSMSCNETCQCAEGYYQRQRGECRRIGFGVGDSCVLDADCQFEGGACDLASLACFNSITGERKQMTSSQAAAANKTATNSAISRQHLARCDVNNPCPEAFECSNLGACVCPIGYYPSADESTCYAELGSPSSQEQCAGLLATVIDGICTCPPNFFFEENMRDCTRVNRRLEDSCTTDANCYTFGAAAVCGEEQPPWGLRSCACDTELAVWDANLQMCRLFAGIGETCEVDSDCMAGDLEILCVMNDAGVGYCACPEGYTDVDGLCLTTGLVLGDACQATQECTGTANTICEDGRCSCDSSRYQEIDGSCAPVIGGVCEQDSDCVIENTVCTNSTAGSTCECSEQFIAYDDACWPVLSSPESNCTVSAQCQQLLGEDSTCSSNQCSCIAGHHLRDGGCWPMTGLFEACTRSSQCYLEDAPERATCRNSLCQCEFHYPYSEKLDTCTSSATRDLVASLFVLAVRFTMTRVVV